MDGKVIYTIKITPLRGDVCAHQAEKREMIRFTTFIVTTYVETVDVRHCSTSATATDLALLKAFAALSRQGIGRASGKVMAGTVYCLRGASRPLPLSTRHRWSRRSGPSSAPCRQRLGEEPASRADVASKQWSSGSWRRLHTDHSVGSSPPLGAGQMSSTSIRPSGREGRTKPGSSARPVTYGW
ncbi:hypothetical protein GWK47_007411 [Chionoecetes opilio]|uniref:Uncharacterized protein n=1 Tax=Chionoecetes opilio TaxID=41210 RepID=A0A8J4Y9Y2_CHIOP|nr:hypothetical protein GWK47_007411 [Chionoecetes opilio]